MSSSYYYALGAFQVRKTFEPPQAVSLSLRYVCDEQYLTIVNGKLAHWVEAAGPGKELIASNDQLTVVTNGGHNRAASPATGGAFAYCLGVFPNSSSYTFIARIQQPELQDNTCIFGTRNSHALLAKAGGTVLGAYTNTYAVEVAHNITPGTMYNVAMDYNAQTNLTRLWVNNVLIGSGQGNGPASSGERMFFLNTYSDGGFPARSMQYAEVAMYSSILSDASRQAWHTYLLTR